MIALQLIIVNLYFHLHSHHDHESLMPAHKAKKIHYPKYDGKITFDKTSSVYLTGTNHEADQPVHLKLKDPDLPINYTLKEFDEPAQRYCPAGVYEVLSADENSEPVFRLMRRIVCIVKLAI